ncbi:MAG TPA: EamA family transporter RarD [Pseudomonadales bacterium]|nr:EamA family transporter RarD [Pseudomonadales bacterium]
MGQGGEQTARSEADRAAWAGALFAISAYGIWGFAPIYFRWIGEPGALQIVAHRVLWSALLLVPLVLLVGGVGRLRAVLARPSSVAMLAATSVLIGANWLLFIYAVVSGRVLEASLGYFINPLVSLVLGMLFLGERLRPLQWLAVAVAAVGVANEVLFFGDVPWLGLALAFSFGFYGLLRKRLGVDSFTGLAVETWLLLPVAVAWLAWNAAQGGDLFTRSAADAGKLFLAGPITMLPLLCFAAAANRLSLGSMGFFQYLAPSIQFVLAVWAFDEPFDVQQWWTFGLIWVALAMFSVSALFDQRRRRRVVAAAPVVLPPEEPAR